jgi:RNA polymerase sporulation-specific sigma factor
VRRNEILIIQEQKKTGATNPLRAIESDGNGNNLSFLDVLCAPDDMLDRLSVRESCALLRRYIEEELTPREAEIIKMRYGLDRRRPRTQREIAADLKISRSYVSRIEKKALEKLEAAFLRDE